MSDRDRDRDRERESEREREREGRREGESGHLTHPAVRREKAVQAPARGVGALR